MLKSKLYGSSVPIATASTNKYQSEWNKPTLYKEKTVTASPQKIVEHHKTQLQAVTDTKMNTFLEQM